MDLYKIGREIIGGLAKGDLSVTVATIANAIIKPELAVLTQRVERGIDEVNARVDKAILEPIFQQMDKFAQAIGVSQQDIDKTKDHLKAIKDYLTKDISSKFIEVLDNLIGNIIGVISGAKTIDEATTSIRNDVKQLLGITKGQQAEVNATKTNQEKEADRQQQAASIAQTR